MGPVKLNCALLWPQQGLCSGQCCRQGSPGLCNLRDPNVRHAALPSSVHYNVHVGRL